MERQYLLRACQQHSQSDASRQVSQPRDPLCSVNSPSIKCIWYPTYESKCSCTEPLEHWKKNRWARRFFEFSGPDLVSAWLHTIISWMCKLRLVQSGGRTSDHSWHEKHFPRRDITVGRAASAPEFYRKHQANLFSHCAKVMFLWEWMLHMGTWRKRCGYCVLRSKS